MILLPCYLKHWPHDYATLHFILFQDTVSVHRPSFYAERFQRFMCNTVFRKPCRLQNYQIFCYCLSLDICVSCKELCRLKEMWAVYFCHVTFHAQWSPHHRRRAVQDVRVWLGGCPWALLSQVPSPAAKTLILDSPIACTLHRLTQMLKLVSNKRGIMWQKKSSMFSNLGCAEARNYFCVFV